MARPKNNPEVQADTPEYVVSESKNTQKTATPNRKYEVWRVKANYEAKHYPRIGTFNEFAGFSKLGYEPVKTVCIEERHAIQLNNQSINSGYMYYDVETGEAPITNQPQ